MELLGVPEEEVKAKVPSQQRHYLDYMEVHQNFQSRQALSSLVPRAPPDVLDLLAHMLTYDPSKRLTAKEILQHPFLSACNPSKDKMIIEGHPIIPFEFEFEKYCLNETILRELITDEVIVSNSKEAELKLEAIQTKFPSGILGKLYFNGDHVSDASGEKNKLLSPQNTSDYSQNFTEKTIYAHSNKAPGPKSDSSEDLGTRGTRETSGSAPGSS